MISRVSQRALALPGDRIPFSFAKRKRLGLQFILNLYLIKALSSGVVIVLGGLASERESTLPHPIGESGDFRRHAGERRGITFDANTQVAPEPPQAFRDRSVGSTF